MQPDKSQPFVIPAPVGGWNARDALPVMDARDALTLDNVFPEANLCRIIGRGTTSDSITATDGFFQTFAEYFPSDGGSFGIVADNKYFRIVNSSGTFTGASRIHGGVARWESVNFNGSIIFVSGSCAPEAYNGTTWSNPTYTGIADPTKLSHIDTYKSRLYFVEANTQKIWYGGIRSISGALTEYDVAGIMRRGGSLVFAGSMTKDTRNGITDFFVIVTNQGEVLYFTGDNPGAANWAIAGRAYIGAPMGKRSVCSFKSDLLVATTDGIVSLSNVLETGEPEYLTTKIQNAYNLAATSASSFDGWELKYWPSGHMLILNVPQSYPTDIHQYVMNTFTGAWCRFKGIQAAALCPLKNKLFYTVRGPSTNSIVEFGTGAQPPDDIEIQSAFLPLGDQVTIKQVKRIRPFWNGPRGFRYYLECPADFEDVRLNNLVRASNANSTPWGSPWGSPWSLGPKTNPSFFAVDCKMGMFFSYRIKTSQANGGDYVPPSGTTLSAVSFIFEAGGII